MAVFTYVLLALALTYQADSLVLKALKHRWTSRQATSSTSQFSEEVLFKDAFDMNASMKNWRKWCKDPANLPMQGTGPDVPNAERQVLLDSVASPARRTTPFLWLHYGDGDFLSLTGHSSSSIECADLNSQCVRDGLSDMFFGVSPPNMTSKTLVYHSLGKFFMCNSRKIFKDMDEFMTPARKAMAKFGWHDDFYLNPGNVTSAAKDSWVVAAQQRKRPVVVVGPKHLDGLHCMFNQVAYFNIPIPTRGCGDVDRIVPQIINFSKTKYPNDSVMFVVAGAAIGKMIAYKAFQSLFDKDIFVEVGASLDGFGGRKSRAYNHPERYCQSHYKKWMHPQACKKWCGGDSCCSA